MPPLNPVTLQVARLSQGLSLAALSSKCGVSIATLSRLENGSREATAEEAASLANSLGLPYEAVCRPLLTERLGLSGFYHRKLSRAGATAVKRVENQCLLDVVALHELFGLVDLPCPDTVVAIDLDDARGDPEEAANMVRLMWQVPRGPIQDLCAVVERGGCVVVHSDFGIPEMDGLYQKVLGVPPIFWVNSRKPLERVRFSIAHELGHLILHEEKPLDHHLAEAQADAFAAAFLLPRADFKSECPSRLWIPELIELKRRWRCSMVSIARRARDVGKITDSQFTSIMVEISRRGWRKLEPYPITGESPRLLASAIRACMASCEYTPEQLAARLAAPIAQVHAWMQPFPGQRAATDSETDGPRLRLVNGY